VEVWNCTPVPGAANNITSGDAPAGSGGCMYRSPTIEYLWPENVPGTPIVANNFQSETRQMLQRRRSTPSCLWLIWSIFHAATQAAAARST
jgi:hypothetical protein